MSEYRSTLERELERLSPPRIPLDQLARRRDREHRDQRIRAGALSLAIAIAVGWLGVHAIRTTPSIPADEPSPVSPVDSSAVAVATKFVKAFGDLDGERAITYLVDTPYLEMDATTPEDVPVFTSLLEAMGYEQIPVGACSVTGSSTFGTAVRCRFDWHNIRSDEIGLGPYPGSWDLTVRDGAIRAASLNWDIKKFGSQMWIPFRDWVSTNHPKDFDVMYVDGGGNYSLTEESIRLWDLRTREFVKEVNRGTTGP